MSVFKNDNWLHRSCGDVSHCEGQSEQMAMYISTFGFSTKTFLRCRHKVVSGLIFVNGRPPGAKTKMMCSGDKDKKRKKINKWHPHNSGLTLNTWLDSNFTATVRGNASGPVRGCVEINRSETAPGGRTCCSVGKVTGYSGGAENCYFLVFQHGDAWSLLG